MSHLVGDKERAERLCSLALQKKLEETYVVQQCTNCDHFDLDGNRCEKYNATPPARVVVIGCDQWAPDIPF